MDKIIATALRDFIIMFLAYLLGGWHYAVLSFVALFAMNVAIDLLTIYFRRQLCLPQ